MAVTITLDDLQARIAELEAQLALAHDGLATAYLAGAESVREELDALRARIAPACQWSPDSDFDIDAWHTSCGRAFCFTEGGPADNGADFCHGCGHPVALLDTPTVEDGDG